MCGFVVETSLDGRLYQTAVRGGRYIIPSEITPAMAMRHVPFEAEGRGAILFYEFIRIWRVHCKSAGGSIRAKVLPKLSIVHTCKI